MPRPTKHDKSPEKKNPDPAAPGGREKRMEVYNCKLDGDLPTSDRNSSKENVKKGNSPQKDGERSSTGVSPKSPRLELRNRYSRLSDEDQSDRSRKKRNRPEEGLSPRDKRNKKNRNENANQELDMEHTPEDQDSTLTEERKETETTNTQLRLNFPNSFSTPTN